MFIIKMLLTVAAVATGLLLVLLLLVYLNYRRTNKFANNLLLSAERDSAFVYRLLRTKFQSSRIIRCPSLPYGNGQRVPADLILVDRGGVFVIRIRNFPGAVDNTNKKTWTVTNEKGVGEFPNPFEQNKYAVNAIETILKHHRLYSIPIHNIVVFSQKNISFKVRTEYLLSADRLIAKISDMNRNRFLSLHEISASADAIRKTSSLQ